MTDTHQAIYDAVRSRISNGDIGSAVENAIRDAGIGDNAYMAKVAIEQAASEYMRPSAVFKPTLASDGDQWCALYGENLQEGVAGFGDTPEKAMHAFDAAWFKAKTPKAALKAMEQSDD